MTLAQIETLYQSIYNSILTINPVFSYDELAEKFIDLANGINEFEGETEEWIYLGEHSEASLDELIIGAFWHYTEWHSGQHSKSYAAYCALNTVYQPNMACAPADSEDEGYATYTMLDEMASKAKDK
jgi:hypothetical protein